MTDYRLFPEERQERIIEIVQEMLPEEADLALLSYTGGRAFGWGHDRHDIDVHGFFASEEWPVRKVHADPEIFDTTLTNIKSLTDPQIRTRRWKNYYDKSKPIYIHPDFAYHEDFMDNVQKTHIEHVWPYDLELQKSRLENSFTPRNALHTYKELLIPLHFLETGEIESDVTVINEERGLDGLNDAVRIYRDGATIELDDEQVWSEIDNLWQQLEQHMEEDA